MTLTKIFVYIYTFLTCKYIMQSRVPNYSRNITLDKCIEETQIHREIVKKMMSIFSNKLKKILKKDKTNARIQPKKLQDLVGRVCEDVATVLEEENYNQNKKRYGDLPNELANVCENTFNDIKNSLCWKLCKGITHKQYKSLVMEVFLNKLNKLWEDHDKDKETLPNLEIYTRLLNTPKDKHLHKEWTETHNYNNTHHVEWFLKCKKPKLQYLVEMVCDNVASAMTRNAKYKDIFHENKERYISKWLPESLAEICTNTFVDLWNTIHF